MIEQEEPTLIRRLFLVCSSKTTPETGRERSVRVDQYELIRTAARVYTKSIRQIARETGHARKTIRKVLAGSEPKYRQEARPGLPGAEEM
jgi:hypothetical protein